MALLPKGTLLQKNYEIIKLLGEGSMGEVYEAQQLALERKVAIKVLKPQLAKSELERRRFLKEAKTSAKLEHPNIVPIIDSFAEGDYLCIVMELISGRSLRELINMGYKWPETLPLLAQVARALAFAHCEGVIHRDLKPSNILVTNDDFVFVTDWGISKCLEDSTGLTKTGVILGTPEYMAPERITQNSSLPESDLYSLGCIIHELFSGTPPFHGGLGEVVNSQVRKIPKLFKAGPAAIIGLTARLLDKDPKERPTSALEVAEIIENSKNDSRITLKMSSLGGQDATSAVTSVICKRDEQKKKIIPFFLAIALALLCLVGGSHLLLQRPKSQKQQSLVIHRLVATSVEDVEIYYDGPRGDTLAYIVSQSNEKGTLSFSNGKHLSGSKYALRLKLQRPIFKDCTLSFPKLLSGKREFPLSVKKALQKLFPPVDELTGDKFMACIMDLCKVRGTSKKLFVTDKERRNEVANTLLKYGFDEKTILELRNRLPHYLREKTLFAPESKRIYPLLAMTCLLPRKLISPPWGELSSALGYSCTKGNDIPPMPAWSLLGNYETRKRDDKGKLYLWLAAPQFFERMKDKGQRDIFQFTTQLALVNKHDSEAFPDVSKMSTKAELNVDFITNKGTSWPPKEAICHIVMRVFDLKHYALFSINDSPEIPLYLTYNFIKAPGEVHVTHVKIPVKYLKRRENKVLLQACRLPDTAMDCLPFTLKRLRFRARF